MRWEEERVSGGMGGRREGEADVNPVAAAAVDVACLVAFDAVGDAVAVERDCVVSVVLGEERRRNAYSA